MVLLTYVITVYWSLFENMLLFLLPENISHQIRLVKKVRSYVRFNINVSFVYGFQTAREGFSLRTTNEPNHMVFRRQLVYMCVIICTSLKTRYWDRWFREWFVLYWRWRRLSVINTRAETESMPWGGRYHCKP